MYKICTGLATGVGRGLYDDAPRPNSSPTAESLDVLATRALATARLAPSVKMGPNNHHPHSLDLNHSIGAVVSPSNASRLNASHPKHRASCRGSVSRHLKTSPLQLIVLSSHVQLEAPTSPSSHILDDAVTPTRASDCAPPRRKPMPFHHEPSQPSASWQS
jgi:hypothetical protein